jgi:hypothetical protein
MAGLSRNTQTPRVWCLRPVRPPVGSKQKNNLCRELCLELCRQSIRQVRLSRPFHAGCSHSLRRFNGRGRPFPQRLSSIHTLVSFTHAQGNGRPRPFQMGRSTLKPLMPHFAMSRSLSFPYRRLDPPLPRFQRVNRHPLHLLVYFLHFVDKARDKACDKDCSPA